MYITTNENWIRYSSTRDWKLSNIKDGGKWMHFYKERSFAEEMITKALDTGVVKYAKHTKGSSGMVCYYVSGTSLEAHYKVISFMLENNLIRLTNSLNYFDVNFKFNGQSWSKEYGNNFEGLLKLSDLIDLHSGKFKYQDLTPKQADETITKLLTLREIDKSSYLQNDTNLQPLLQALDRFVISKVNKLFDYDREHLDFNDKMIHLAPSGYNLHQLYKSKSASTFLAISAMVINYLLLTADSRQLIIIEKLIAKDNLDANTLINMLQMSSMTVEDGLTTTLDNRLARKFIASFNLVVMSEEFTNIIGYLLFISLEAIDQTNFDFISNNLQIV